MKAAVIRTGGKQYFVSEGDMIKVERLAAQPGDTLRVTDVLLTTTDETTQVGTPLVSGSAVEAIVVSHGLSQKVTGVKMKPKKRYRRLFGHRQSYTTIEIKNIKTPAG